MANNESEMTISMITHEIRNPVALINSYLQLIEKSHPEVHHFTYWDQIQAEMAHLRALLENISFCQNTPRLHKLSVNINHFLQTYSKTAISFLSKNDYVTFHFLPEHNLPCVFADPDRLRQILDNLIRNALEAVSQTAVSETVPQTAMSKTVPQTTASENNIPSENTCTDAPFYIQLRAKLQDGFLCIEVSDNGCGIPADNLATLFDPFVTHKPQGTGLGLAICARIAKAHGGTLTCTSLKDPTTFQLLLPAQIRR